MISSIFYNGDGSTRIFPVTFKINGEDYVRVYVDNVEVVDRTKYDIINNSIVFAPDDIPAVGTDNIKIYVATSASELGDLGAPLTDITNVANSLAEIVAVSTQVIPNLPEILLADNNATIATSQATIATTQAGEASASATSASTSANNASASETNSALSEANALSYKNSASDSADTATTQAGIATTKAGEASTSASQALGYRNEALGYRNEAEASALSVDSANLVHKTGDETIAGVKTFSSSPIVPDATTATQAMAYGQGVNLTGAQTIAGVKTLTDGLKLQNQNVSPFSGFKNYIINGKKTINQRGTTSTNNSYNHDRWYKAGNNWFQGIEGDNNLINGKTYTLSWAGVATASYYVGTATSATIDAQSFTSVANGGNFILTISAGQNLWIKFSSDATGSTFNFVQLEGGSVATPFENRPYGLELSLCQRYYEVLFFPNNATIGLIVAHAPGTPAYRHQDFCVSKRVVPSMSISGTTNTNFPSVGTDNVTTTFGTPSTQGFDHAGSGLVPAGTVGRIFASSDFKFLASAEL